MKSMESVCFVTFRLLVKSVLMFLLLLGDLIQSSEI